MTFSSAASGAASELVETWLTQVSRALFAALHSAINETLATSYLAVCLEQARTETVTTALRHIIEDEVRHARIGCAVLASDKLSDADPRVVSNTLPSLLEICVSAWLAETACDVDHAVVTPPQPLGIAGRKVELPPRATRMKTPLLGRSGHQSLVGFFFDGHSARGGRRSLRRREPAAPRGEQHRK